MIYLKLHLLGYKLYRNLWIIKLHHSPLSWFVYCLMDMSDIVNRYVISWAWLDRHFSTSCLCTYRYHWNFIGILDYYLTSRLVLHSAFCPGLLLFVPVWLLLSLRFFQDFSLDFFSCVPYVEGKSRIVVETWRVSGRHPVCFLYSFCPPPASPHLPPSLTPFLIWNLFLKNVHSRWQFRGEPTTGVVKICNWRCASFVNFT